MPRGGRCRLDGYGDLGAGTRAGPGDGADEPVGEVAKAAALAPKGWAVR